MLAKALLLSAAIAAPALGQSFDLGQYQHAVTFPLPTAASEASAIAFNWDNGNLFVLGDEGDALVEVSRTGSVVSTMTLTGFDDTEGLTYIGGGRFVLAEERLQDAFVLTYAGGGSVDRSALQSASLGPTVGNVGIEGISFEPSTGLYFAVKEKTPQAVLQASINFPAGSANVSDLFVPNLGVLDLSDIQVLSVVPGLIGTADQDNLIILSQESSLLLEVSRTGTILSQFSLAALSSSAEGVTIDWSGIVYVCDETPNVYVLIPSPSTAALFLAAPGLITRRRRRA